MKGDEINLAGRLCALEYVIEVMLANQMALLSHGDAEGFFREVINQHGSIRGGPIDADDVTSMEKAAADALQALLGKAEARAYEIRAKSAAD